ncbi:MAG: B12-binding domain-containing radical SAM protein [Candidatus Levybacteria bacterium]|nr:B12-binding domain-containing radical SAM protein [Candidatus Levybacteria bacterium]
MSIEHIRPISSIKLGPPDILFINVPASFQQGIIPDEEMPPFGILRLATTTEQHGHRPMLLDAHRAKLNLSEIDNVLYELKPKSVGINPTSINVLEAQGIAELCDQRKIPLILGGVHATLDPFTAIEKDFPMARAVVKGKGEKVVSQILNDIELNQQTKMKGVYYSDTDKTITDFADYYTLNQLPLIDQKRWVENPLTKKNIQINGKDIELTEISLYETSGCPFQCTYCATPNLVDKNNGNKAYYRPTMNRILTDVKSSIELGANAIHFIDDLAFAKPNHFHEFANGIKKLKLSNQLYWRGMTRAPIIADQCSNEDLTIIAQSGCWRIAMGIESGDEKMIKRIKKNITLEQTRKAVNKLRAAGIPQVKAFFVMGFPEETLEQIEATYKFIMELKNLGLTDISIFQFKPYPGTEEWQYLERTNPNVLKNLFYVKQGINNSIVDRKIARDATLPDDLQIAAVSSRIVKEIIIKTMKDFYDN